jgi:hypothetical protein
MYWDTVRCERTVADDENTNDLQWYLSMRFSRLIVDPMLFWRRREEERREEDKEEERRGEGEIREREERVRLEEGRVKRKMVNIAKA